ncbi:MAG: hypothetical protein LC792_08020 [Actinobacteria bacterium]|nr:hypothetical protein [Actinomycetota bacterium]
MPVLEDTADFKVATLNDLLDADVRTGVPVAADDKYKRWAFLSTGLAGMLLIALIVSLVTGGGDKGGGNPATKSAKAPPNTVPFDVQVGSSVPSGLDLNAPVIIFDVDGNAVAGGTVTEIKEAAGFGKTKRYMVVVAVANGNDVNVVTKADSTAKAAGGSLTLRPGTFQPTTTTTAPAAAVPIQPAPATTPTS